METIQADSDLSLCAVDQDPRWIAVQHLIASKSFSKSIRLTSFLTYICRCALEGRSDEITEQQIGIHVFDRPTGYNPGDDNIVRTTARQLRQRLALYYQEEGIEEEIRIEVPRGGYHPSFLNLSGRQQGFPVQPILSIEPDSPPQPVAAHGYRLRLGPVSAATLLIFAIAFGCGLTMLTQRILQKREQTTSPTAALWSALFVANRPTLFVPGDAGLNIYNNLARTQVTLGDYATGSYLSTPEAQPPAGYTWASLATRRYVSFVDLQFADRLRVLGNTHHAQYSIRFARDLHPSDFRDSNVVLAGSATYNPWIALFDNQLNFHLQYDGTHNTVGVLNRRPQNGEPDKYDAGSSDPSNRGYTHGFGYIALTNNLEGNGKVLLVEGSTVAGVDAAVSFLLNDVKMSPILQKASKGHGSLGNFEILLGANFLKSSSPDARTLATRFY